MAQDTHGGEDSDRRRHAAFQPERRHDPRLPEELTAVFTESAVASSLFDRLPADARRREADWVAGGADRGGRARRAVEVVRHVLGLRSRE